MENKYRSGRITEGKVVNLLKSKGFYPVLKSRGSRTPADIRAWKNGLKYLIQVKKGCSIPRKEIKKLQEFAMDKRGVAVTINKCGSNFKWKFLGNWN